VTHHDLFIESLEVALHTVTTNEEARIIRASRSGERSVRDLAAELGDDPQGTPPAAQSR
jgi:hypothetical protein